MDPSVIAVIMNGGALGILGYHLLWGLPSMMTMMMKEQQTERIFWATQADRDRAAFAERAALIAAAVRTREDVLDARAVAREKIKPE